MAQPQQHCSRAASNNNINNTNNNGNNNNIMNGNFTPLHNIDFVLEDNNNNNSSIHHQSAAMSPMERDVFMRNLYIYDNEQDRAYKKIIANIFDFCYFFITMRIYPDLDHYELLYDRIIAFFRESPPNRLYIISAIYNYSQNYKNDFKEIHIRMSIIQNYKTQMFKTPRCQLKGDLYLKYAELVQIDQGRWLKLIKSIVNSIETLYNSGNMALSQLEDTTTFSCFMYVIKHIILSSDVDRMYTDRHLKFSNKFISQKEQIIKVYDLLTDLEYRYLYLEPEFLEYTAGNRK